MSTEIEQIDEKLDALDDVVTAALTASCHGHVELLRAEIALDHAQKNAAAYRAALNAACNAFESALDEVYGTYGN
jgi:hypothetical protein